MNGTVQETQAGACGWFLDRDGENDCLYEGEAGKRKGTQRGTLYRGVSGLQGATFSSDKHCHKLDTDFVVSAAIRYLMALGHSVYRQQLSDDPAEENR